MRRGEQLRSLRHKNFRWFFLGETINTAGSSMSGIALSFAVLHIDNSPTALGWVVAAWTVPMVAFMLIGGAIADRFPRALVLRGCNLLEGVTQAASAFLVLSGTAHIWQLILLQFVSGTAVAISYPAFHGMVPVLLPEPDRKSAYLLLSQAQSALSIFGPAVAGILVAASSPGWALAIDAGTYVAAAFFLTLLKLPGRRVATTTPHILADFRQGWSFSRALGWVIPVACCSLVFNALISGALNVLGPVIAKGTVGSTGWGYARAAQAVGLFVFAFVLARITLRRPLLACQVGFVTTAVPMFVLAVWAHTIPLSVAFFVSGCGSAVINLAWSMTVQEKVPEHMLSRVNAIDGFFSFVAMPVGQLLVGPAAHFLTPRQVELGAAALCVLTFLVGITRAPLRHLRLGEQAADAVQSSG
ncbi:MFS transporter [Flexivirga caeni]|uniref:MFS transporter n=1 Tax=Flexivirga caeni TaxID=2294115 RepID=A0A3M9MBZ4_9MICO|nr:MFS transporter [Flexivirga caeni]RNI23066.1 MFS transporter [Flexivirga caeni]